LINNQTDGSLNLLNINRIVVFADDHLSFPPIYSRGRAQKHQWGPQGRAEPAGAR
jgi:hypothetical protein